MQFICQHIDQTCKTRKCFPPKQFFLLSLFSSPSPWLTSIKTLAQTKPYHQTCIQPNHNNQHALSKIKANGAHYLQTTNYKENNNDNKKITFTSPSTTQKIVVFLLSTIHNIVLSSLRFHPICICHNHLLRYLKNYMINIR